MKLKQIRKEELNDAFISNSELFKKYQDVEFGKKNSESTSAEQVQFSRKNIKAVRYAAIVIILTALFWIITDVMRGGELRLTTGPALAAIICQFALSIYMIVLSFVAKDKPGNLVRFSFLFYYLFLILIVTVLGVTKNMVILETDKYSRVVGIPLSTYYLVIIIMAPLPSLVDSIILGVYYLGMQFVPLFLPGSEIYSLSQQLILAICMIVAYYYVRGVNISLSKSMKRLSVLSYTDSLTSVLNRRSLDTYWKDICASKKVNTVGVLIFDIDDFKKYNDFYTHTKGDDVLIGVCRIVMNEIEKENGFLFRYGGEEFVVLLIDYEDEDILRCAKNIRKAIYEGDIGRGDIEKSDRITVTIGCSKEVIRETLVNDYVTVADKQLYIGKSQGKNCVVFNETIYE